MPITITFGDKPPLIIHDYDGMFLEDIKVEYEVEQSLTSEDSLPPFNFTTSPVM